MQYAQRGMQMQTGLSLLMLCIQKIQNYLFFLVALVWTQRLPDNYLGRREHAVRKLLHALRA